MPVVKAPNETVLKAGIYPAVFNGIEERSGKNPTTGEENVYWRWTFAIRTKAGEKELIAASSMSFGKKAKARGWAEAILNRAIKPGEEIDLDKLIGMECQVVLSVKDIEGYGNVNRIDNVVAIPSANDEDMPF